MPQCGDPVTLPECQETTPGPTDTADVEVFVAENAVPLQCGEAGNEQWDFTVFDADFRDTGLFMFGEVHYSNELGVISAALFEFLVREGQVNALSMEFGMDVTDAMNDYIQTGGGDMVTVYSFNQLPATMFVRTLLDKAHELYLEGYELTAFGVDHPSRLTWVNDEIEALAASLVDSQDLVLDTMPQAPPGAPPFIMDDFPDEAKAYYQHITDNLETICAELDDADCERLEMLTRGLWLGAFAASMAMFTATEEQVQEFFSTREPLIVYNYRTNIPTEDVRVYTHMGAAHTSKGATGMGFTGTAGQMDTDYPVTTDRVYSTSPGYGEGSQIAQGGFFPQTLPAEPATVASALEDAPVDTYYVSTQHPSHDCVDTPMYSLFSSMTLGFYGMSYDALVFVRKLTPATSGFKSASRTAIPPILQVMNAVHYGEWRLQQYHAEHR